MLAYTSEKRQIQDAEKERILTYRIEKDNRNKTSKKHSYDLVMKRPRARKCLDIFLKNILLKI